MKKLKYAALSLTTAFLALPVVVSAQFTAGNAGELGTFGGKILTFINDVVTPLLFAIALVLFIYGAFVFLIQGGGEEESREKGRRYMFWGIIALAILVSVWGITNLIAGGLGFSKEQTIDSFIPNANQQNQ